MDGNREICYVAELAKENGKLKTFEHENKTHYIAQIKSGEEVVEERLVPIETEPVKIREFLSAWARRRDEILKAAQTMIIIENFN